MTTYAWPTDRWAIPQTFAWGAIDRTASIESPYTGDVQTDEVPFSFRWRVELTLAPTKDFATQAAREGFLSRIRRSHRVAIPHFGFGKNGFAPFGTLRGVPIASGSAAQGATTLGVTTTGAAGQTVAAGDLLGITTVAGVQYVRAVVPATAAGNALSLTFEPPLRAAVNAGATIVWNKPAPTFLVASSDWSVEYQPGLGRAVALSFLEVW